MSTLSTEDKLIGSVVANEADQLEWNQFEDLAKTTPPAWENLARTLRDELQVRSALDSALAGTDAVEIPDHAFTPSPIASLRNWQGWAIAAMIAIAWLSASMFSPVDNQPTTNVAGFASTPDEAFDQYMKLGTEHGRVLQELPMVMIETFASSEEGRLEIVYVRQVLERAQVGSAWQLNRDDLGRPTPVRVNLASFNSESDM